MKTFASFALTMGAAAVFAACGGSQPPSAPNSVSSSGPASGGMGPMAVKIPNHPDFPALAAFNTSGLRVHSDHHKSWVSPDLRRINYAPVLFVSDASTNDVYIYWLSSFKLKGTLTGFDEPEGMCSDASGNVWVTNTNTSQILKFSRTGTHLNTLSDRGYYPLGCAVNETNGDVAVTNVFSTSFYGGNVMIYAKGIGGGTPITNPNQLEYYFAAYDTSGNLYVDGRDNGYYFMLSRCSSSSCSTMNVSGGSLHYPGGVSWDRVNNNLVVGDQNCNEQFASCLYQMTVSGSSASITGSTPLTDYNGTPCDVIQGSLGEFSGFFAGPCLNEYGTSSSVAARWPYPAGGAASTYSVLSLPVGSAISY
jgi:hypothetical protein